jgi:DNA-binding transcriptional regulator LsrR (DeoR family)
MKTKIGRSRRGLEIRIKMMRAGVSAAQIAEQLGVTEPFVHQVITETRDTQYVREAIAKALKKPVEKLWPNHKRKEIGRASCRERV